MEGPCATPSIASPVPADALREPGRNRRGAARRAGDAHDRPGGRPRRTGRGGQGLLAQDLTKKGGRLAASFPVEEDDEILLVTDQGQLIRTPVNQVRMVGRNTSGVTIFRTGKEEHVVSVERLEGQGGGDEIEDEGEGAAE